MALIINGERIDEAVVGQEFSEIKSHYERLGRISCCERDDEFRGYARDNIVGRVLLTQQAKHEGDPVSEQEIDDAVEQLKQEHGGEQQFYFNMGLSPEQEDLVRGNVATSLAVDKLLRKVCGEEAEPSAEELKQFHEDNLDEYRTVEEVRASHILKSVEKSEDREPLFHLMCGLRRKAMEGADFDELAREHSDKPPEEIDLGWFKRGELMDEFEVMAFSMDKDEVSPVFTIHGSFHLAKVTDKKPAQPIPFEEVREQVREAVLQSRRDRRIREYIDGLKAKATIEEIEEEEAEK